MATKLKNILRHPACKVFLYLSFVVLIFSFSLYTVNNMLSNKEGKYFKNFTYESFLTEDFFESSYVDALISIALVNIDQLAEEFSLPEYNGKFKEDKINYISRNYDFLVTRQLFASDKKFSYYFETTDGYRFASEDLRGMNKLEIKDKIYESSLYAWIDYSIDEMSMDSDSSAKVTRAKLSNRNFYDSVGNLENIRAVYVSYNDKVLNIARKEWNLARDHYQMIKLKLLDCIGALLFIFLLLVLGSGRKPNSEEKIEFFFDAIFIEFKLFSIIPAILALDDVISMNLYEPNNSLYRAGLISVSVTAVAAYCLLIVMSIIRNLKSNNYRKRFLIYCISMIIVKIAKFLLDFFKAIFISKPTDAQNTNRKLRKYFNLYVLLSAILMFLAFFLSLSMGIYELWLLVLFVELLVTALFSIKIKNSLLQLNQEFEDRVKEASKSEKMKTELITNVSHDLKTPLTSIIGYIDLLGKEELNEVSRDYVRILEQKSNKLKDIIEDLFALSKSESGSMDVDMQVIDLKKLIKQTLATMDDKILSSGLHIKTLFPDTELYIKSDGRKLYRVMQNLIDNALKYSLKGTRIFISLQASVDNKVTFRIKNTSSYEMNFSKEEITARFVRGDKSRSDDGSGLGLAIVESFTNTLGGKFDLAIDGDLFIVELEFDLIDG